ncbi:hypothetical protein CWE13_10560 [Aliidiomarina shirensis]|uniref:DUF4920 domain-containing protein n=1 Tax=Aliidiomarina shirensis TaxID=1048642 RepID=A0A432WQC6_9GAMM|nr:DUF4920 domain-containing protein [Aliidiomarina shirensis]RUO35975.1 hypothetical protein CWE13_10560 [Aliidiomarina shirensis]
MKNLTATILFALSFLFLANAHAMSTEALQFGDEVPDTEVTNLETFFENPNSYIGKTILVEGVITNSCENMGCWMTLKTSSDHELFRIKVNDGEMVFPIEARGRTAWAYGSIETVEVPAGDSDNETRTMYQLRPTGVKVAAE